MFHVKHFTPIKGVLDEQKGQKSANRLAIISDLCYNG